MMWPLNCRAEKFGVEYREPERRRDLRHVVRKEKAMERAAARPVGFTPGLDLYSQVLNMPYASSTPCSTRLGCKLGPSHSINGSGADMSE